MIHNRGSSRDMDTSVVIRNVGSTQDDDNVGDVSMADVSMMSLNDSSMMMAVPNANATNTSMAGISDNSGGAMKRVTS